jgi:hypothetical protein
VVTWFQPRNGLQHDNEHVLATGLSGLILPTPIGCRHSSVLGSPQTDPKPASDQKAGSGGGFPGHPSSLRQNPELAASLSVSKNIQATV